MSHADRLSPSQRDRLARLQMQSFIDEHVEGPQRQSRAEQLARAAARRRPRWKTALEAVALPTTVILLVLALLAFALILISPHRLALSPFNDAIGAPADMPLNYTGARPPQEPRPPGRTKASAPKAVNLIGRFCGSTADSAAWQDRATLSTTAAAIARAAGLPARLVIAQVGVESSFNPHARGKAGELGPLQLSAAVADRWGVDRADPCENLVGGVLELRSHYHPEGGWTLALARYNGRGPMARAYAQRVLRAWEASGDE